ncbi:oxygen-dependent protoporphyrinogen oxidase [Knoellia remsis]|uniref:Oxygen-dependent protoporphyrinogen oxidase n=1 Tax=Knoellia remsis TaxID=407159 RepID=A0A2T0TUW3_9MICO|nr:protoporphyrinogen oxidase [Knoellia remsis]PRY49440.1 oxygen-dependent protoporphyrinogen oxidase [Knoellia remsis]
MPRLSFIAGLAAGYVLGARAGKQRYAQIKKVSTKVWQSQPVQRQVASAKESARTKAAPVVADFVADAAKQTSERLRASKTVPSQVSSGREQGSGDAWIDSATTKFAARADDPWAKATRN